jgi:hypothetical protein
MHPAKELDPLVPEILRLARYPIDDLYPKSWPLPQTDVFERTERKRNKGPELALKPRRHRPSSLRRSQSSHFNFSGSG